MKRLGYKDAAEIAGVSVRKIRYLVASGELVARRCGSRVLIAERDLDEWLDSLPLVVGVDDETETESDDENNVGHPRAEGATRTRAASLPTVVDRAAA